MAKVTMFATFVLRLHHCYHDIADNKWYSARALRIIYALGVFGMLFFAVMITIFMGEQTEPDPINIGVELIFTDQFPFYCEIYPSYVPLMVFVLADLMMSILNLWLFRKPLKDAEDRMKANHSPRSVMKFNTKLKAVRMRTKVLVFTACISSISYVVIGGGMGLWFLFGLDNVINCLSMAFMQGAYYDDHTNKCYSYKKMCHLCAKCCDRKGYSMRYESTRKDRKSSTATHTTGVSGQAPSADTLTVNLHMTEVTATVCVGEKNSKVLQMQTVPSHTNHTDNTTLTLNVNKGAEEVRDATPDLSPDVDDADDEEEVDETSPMHGPA